MTTDKVFDSRLNNPFDKKGYGRIFVADESKIPEVLEAIEAVDEFEASYMPKGFVTKWSGDCSDLIYTQKFEICQNALTEYCWNKGIWIYCVSRGRTANEW